jgi:hypothetical protein
MCEQPYEPRCPALKHVRARISEDSWLERVVEARRREKLLRMILKSVASGKSQNAAIEAVVPKPKRSATLRDLKNYHRDGFEGLIDQRTPREPEIEIWIRDAIEIARMANPSISVESVERILEKKYENVASPAFIKRVWKDAGLERKKGRPERRELESTKEPDTGKVEVEPLKAAGFQLVFAGEAETEAVERLVDTVMAVADDLPPPGAVPQSERELRDEKGQFTGSYNRARRTAPGELIGPAHRTASEKAEARDLGRLTFSEQQRETLDRKVWALVSLPAVTPANGRTEDLRGPQGELLGEMCGYDYQRLCGKWCRSSRLPALGLSFSRHNRLPGTRLALSDGRPAIVRR